MKSCCACVTLDLYIFTTIRTFVLQEEVPYAIFAVEWFTTLFVYNFNFETSRAALSLFFVEGGMVFTVQLGIALLYKYQESLLGLRFDTLVPWLKSA